MAKKNKRRGPEANDRVKTPAELKPAPTPAELSRRGGRETVDALVIAFVLAFLIRTFEAEAFVIPTGSMAPTLMGRHKDVYCDRSGVRYKVSHSDRERQLALLEARRRRLNSAQTKRLVDGVECVAGQSPQSGRLMPLTDNRLPRLLRRQGEAEATQTANYSGDRLVVSKYSYEFSDPERWDVAVFKYPGNSQENYIKRVVGLPEEELQIFQGDLYTRPLRSEEPYRIARKPPKVVMAMRQFVHDTDHESAAQYEAGWPLAWSGTEGWNADIGQQPRTIHPGVEVLRLSYRGEAPPGETEWLRYRHSPPGEGFWDRLLSNPEARVDRQPAPRLVTDFTPYNTRLNLNHAAANGALSLEPRPGAAQDLGRIGVHWVGDLMIEADFRMESAVGLVSFDVVEAGDHYGVTIDVATGEASLWRRAYESEEREELATAVTPVLGLGEHAVRVANVDNRLLLWVNDKLVKVEAAYDDEPGETASRPQAGELDEGDLAPAGVGISGGKLVVNRLRLWRDGYYFATDHTQPNPNGFTTDLPPSSFQGTDRIRWQESMLALADDSRLWYALENRRRVDFPIEKGQLFVMGDNSGFSLDARLWAGGNGGEGGRPGGPYLERKQLVGKAVCVYWPHAWYSLPFTRRVVPAWPNFQDMRLVR